MHAVALRAAAPALPLSARDGAAGPDNGHGAGTGGAERTGWREVLLPLLPATLSAALAGLPDDLVARVVEIRLRAGRPLFLLTDRDELMLAFSGHPTADPARAVRPGAQEIEATLHRLAQGGLYAVEGAMRQGFITIPGGHRVGLGGRAVVGADGRVQTLVEVTSLAIRLARPVPGAANRLWRQLLMSDGAGGRRLASTLILSPPGAGKTTLLRDLARRASTGVPEAGLAPAQVVVVDERSEIAGCLRGVPQLDVGPRTDVLDACPKVEGIIWAVRALNPGVLVTDEIGTAADVAALAQAANAGTTLLASAHAADLQQARRRAGLDDLLARGLFEKVVVLSRRQGPGTIERVETL